MDIPERGQLSKLRDEMLSFSIVKSAAPNTVGPRLGSLIIPRRKPIQTPHYLALTSRGVIPHISQDTLRDNTDVKGVYLALEDCEALCYGRTAGDLLRRS
jgi:queuine tRNA-ribosyltransferase subunit QTRTD1